VRTRLSLSSIIVGICMKQGIQRGIDTVKGFRGGFDTMRCSVRKGEMRRETVMSWSARRGHSR
jgi:hypothetical protein